MARIFTREAIAGILGQDGITPEQATEQVFGLYGRALDDGYISKSAASAAQQTALDNARTEWEKNLSHPDPTESEQYKALAAEYASYKTMQQARTSAEFEGVKPKYFDFVYERINRSEGAEPIADQLTKIKAQYGECFDSNDSDADKKNTPQYSKAAGHAGANPAPESEKLYEKLKDLWK